MVASQDHMGTVDFMGPYQRRIIDDELDELFTQLPAILLDGPKGVGKTSTAEQCCVTVRRHDVEAERQVVKALWKGVLQTDELAREAGIGSAQLGAMLLGLEMKRVIRILPGRVVELRGEVKPAPELESGANR